LDALGPASDVYSLGATLYCLLTGQPPFAGQDAEAVLRRVQRGDFPPPRAVTAGVPAALEAVCLKAMALLPADRYESARALADDIEHWLADEPVSAHREPWPARLARWGRRHRPLVAAALALLLTAVAALAAGIVALNREKQRTEQALAAESQARKRTREALDAMSSQVIEDWLARKDKLEPAQRAFLEKALAYYETFAEESGAGEEVRRGVADAHLRVGKIRYRLGQHPGAEAAYRRARELFGSLAADFPAVPEYRREQAASVNSLGILLWHTGRPKEAEASYREALDLLKSLAADYPAEPRYRQELAQGQLNLGTLLKDVGRAREAEAAYTDARDLFRRLAADFPREPRYRELLAGTQNNLAVLLQSTGRTREAEGPCRDALALYQALAADFPAVPEYRQELAAAHNNLSVVLRDTGRPREAEAAGRDGLEIYRRLAADFPAVPQYRRELAASHYNLGTLLAITGRPGEAEAAFGDALGIQKRLAADFPNVPEYRAQVANTLDGLAELARGRKDFPSARRLLEQARAEVQAALDANALDPFFHAVFCENRQLLAATLLDLGDHTAAAEAAAELTRVAFDPAGNAFKAAEFFARCVPLAEKDARLLEGKRKELAKSYADQALAALRQAVGKGYRDAANLKKDPDLDPLRGRDDFQKLLAEVAARAEPKKGP
jgi:tetratricopeptide (TPR) repeat protein